MRFICKQNRSGTINVLLLGIIALLSLYLLLHLSVLTLQRIDSRWQQLNDDTPSSALLCAFPLRELLQDNFDRNALLLPDTEHLCLLPATDYGDRWLENTRLNALLCALLEHSDINNFQAWGRRCS